MNSNITIRHTKPREPCQMSVRFSDPQVKTIDIDYLDEQANNLLWYSNRDLNQIDRKNRFVIRALKKARGNVAAIEKGGDEYCIRGLEHKLSIRAQIERQTNTVCVIQSVLDEQKRQRDLGVKDPNRIQSQSLRASQKASTLAVERAKLDELETMCLYANLQNNNKDWTTTSSRTTSSPCQTAEVLKFTEQCLQEALRRSS